MQKIKEKASRILMLFSLFVFCSLTANAQQKTISGTVTDGSGEPIIGANIQVKGTTAGTVSDIDGKFSLKVPENGKTLVVSYVGFNTMELAIDKTVFNISMSENATDLNELVVIGYGSVKKKDLTGSISMVKGDALVKVPVANVAEAITGRMAGVRVTTTDGSPDADIMIRVRGGGSITQDNSPLYVVDGFPVSTISNIPSTDIEDITVLKDASSTAIYGAQGANGVILITTRKPKEGRVEVSYNGFMQSKRLSKRMNVMDPYEYVKFNYELAALGGSAAISSFNDKFGLYEDIDLYKYQQATDWQDQMFGNSILSQQHAISLNGGNESTQYMISGVYNSDGGLMPYSDYSRYSLNFQLNQKISKTVKFYFNARSTDTETNGNGSAGGTDKVRTYQAVTRGPVVGCMNVFDQTLYDNMTEDERTQWNEANMSFAELEYQYWTRKNNRLFTYNAFLEWNILPNLTYHIEGTYAYGFNENKAYNGIITTVVSNSGGLPLVTWQKTNTTSWREMNNLNYQLKLGKSHSVNIMIGQEAITSGSNQNSITANGFSTQLTPEDIFANLGLAKFGSTASSSVSQPNNIASFFGRAVGHLFNDRFLVTATFRADGSSKFAPGHQWGYFPAAAVAWNVAEEKFMSNAKDWLNQLKLRASYGEAGNNRIDPRQFVLGYGISTSGNYAIGDVQNNYWASNSKLPNPDIKWESMVTKNGGVDFGLFHQRLSGTVEYYHNTSKNLLLPVNITAPGYSTIIENIGQTTNKGVDITLNGLILPNSKTFSLSANFNIGFNHSNVDALDSPGNYLAYPTGWASTDLQGYNEYEIHVGQPVGIIYGWVTDGYYTTNDFSSYDAVNNKYILKDGVPSDASLAKGEIGVRPGTIKFKDINGDGVIDDKDRVPIGNANPKFQGGFGFDGQFLKNFDYSLFFTFVYGNDIYNANKAVMTQQYRTDWPNLLNYMNTAGRYTYLADDGTVVTDLATLAAMNEGANAKKYWSPLSFGNSNAVVNSWLIEDGSFLRLQNVTLGYTLPQKISSKFDVQLLRAYCTLNNAWIWTKYSGYDPEVSSAGRGSTPQQLIPGLDYSGYPKSFSWTVGLNLTF